MLPEVITDHQHLHFTLSFTSFLICSSSTSPKRDLFVYSQPTRVCTVLILSSDQFIDYFIYHRYCYVIRRQRSNCAILVSKRRKQTINDLLKDNLKMLQVKLSLSTSTCFKLIVRNRLIIRSFNGLNFLNKDQLSTRKNNFQISS